MKVSIVIPAYNEERLLPDTLAAVRHAAQAFAALGWESEIVVCDNNSADRTGQVADAHGARVVFEPVNQIARARNTGASAASGDWLIFVDADSRPCVGLFAEVAQCMQNPECIGGGSTVVFEKPVLSVRLLIGLWNALSRALRYVAGSFVFCRTSVFREMGGFSQELYVSEEIEFSRRLKQLAKAQGKRVVILHRHPLRTSSRKLDLYSRGEYLRFVLKAMLSGGEDFKRREKCHIWYDGRR
jgi:glycosyltransferase involved in cell wall biosynthesis